MEQKGASVGRIDAIDGLRGWSIIAIILMHAIVWPLRFEITQTIEIGSYFFRARWALISLHLAVPLFFVLSGFVLTLPYFIRKRNMESASDFWQFTVRRARRLLPLYFIGFLTSAIFIFPDPHPSQTLKNVFFMSTLTARLLHPHLPNPYSGAFWSLEVEWWASLLLGLSMLIVRRISMQQIVCVAITISMLGMLWIISDGPAVHPNQLYSRIEPFFLGMAAAKMYAERTIRWHSPQLFSVAAMFFAIGFIMHQLMLTKQVPWSTSAISFLLVDLSFFFLLLGSIESKGAIVHWLLKNRIIRMLGMMCYSLYVWNGLAAVLLSPWLNIFRLGRYAFLLFLFSFLTYRYIEFGHVSDLRKLLPAKSDPKYRDL